MSGSMAGVWQRCARPSISGPGSPSTLAADAPEPLADHSLVAAIRRLVEPRAPELFWQVRLALRDAALFVVRVAVAFPVALGLHQLGHRVAELHRHGQGPLLAHRGLRALPRLGARV